MDFVTVCLIVSAAVYIDANPFLSPLPDGKECTRFFHLREKAHACASQPQFELAPVSPTEVLELVTYSCQRKQEERKCMEDETADCLSKDMILSKWDDSFNFCQDDAPADWITMYATLNPGSVSVDCLNKFKENMGECAIKAIQTIPNINMTLQEGTDAYRSLTRNGYQCAIAHDAMMVSSTPECDGASWKDVIFVTFLQLVTVPGEGFTFRLPDDQMSMLKVEIRTKHNMQNIA